MTVIAWTMQRGKKDGEQRITWNFPGCHPQQGLVSIVSKRELLSCKTTGVDHNNGKIISRLRHNCISSNQTLHAPKHNKRAITMTSYFWRSGMALPCKNLLPTPSQGDNDITCWVNALIRYITNSRSGHSKIQASSAALILIVEPYMHWSFGRMSAPAKIFSAFLTLVLCIHCIASGE